MSETAIESSGHVRQALFAMCWLFVLAATAFGLLFVNFTADDAYITFRYAQNLAEHGQWSWNAGHVLRDVEAYTNPLFAALAVPGHLLGLPAMLPFKLLGLVVLCLIFRTMLKRLSPGRQAVSAAFVCANFYIFPHAFSGLETDAFLLAALLTLDAQEDDLCGPAFSAMLLVAPLLRPEGALISLYILFTQARLRRLNRWTGLFIALGLAYMAWRVQRYGQWLPNTYYAKMNQTSSFIANLQTEKYAVAQGLLSLWVLRRLGLPVLLPAMMLVGFVLGNLRADMQMNYLHRFSHHLVVPIALHAARALLMRAPSPFIVRGWLLNGVSLAGMFTLSIATLSLHQSFFMLDHYPRIVQMFGGLAQVLRTHAPASAILAAEDIGVLSYGARLTTIDYVGLASREVTGYLRGERDIPIPAPDVMLLYSASASSCEPTTAFLGIQALKAHIADTDRYDCIRGLNLSPGLYLNALIRKDSPQAMTLSAAITRYGLSASLQPRTRGEALSDAVRLKALREELSRR